MSQRFACLVTQTAIIRGRRPTVGAGEGYATCGILLAKSRSEVGGGNGRPSLRYSSIASSTIRPRSNDFHVAGTILHFFDSSMASCTARALHGASHHRRAHRYCHRSGNLCTTLRWLPCLLDRETQPLEDRLSGLLLSAARHHSYLCRTLGHPRPKAVGCMPWFGAMADSERATPRARPAGPSSCRYIA